MRLLRKFQACLLFFFFTKRFRSHKKPQSLRQATFTLLEVCARKRLLPLLFSVSLFLFCWFIFACDVFLCARNLFVKFLFCWFIFACDVFLCARNLFVKKIINRLEIVLIASIYYLAVLGLFGCFLGEPQLDQTLYHCSKYLKFNGNYSDSSSTEHATT